MGRITLFHKPTCKNISIQRMQKLVPHQNQDPVRTRRVEMEAVMFLGSLNSNPCSGRGTSVFLDLFVSINHLSKTETCNPPSPQRHNNQRGKMLVNCCYSQVSYTISFTLLFPLAFQSHICSSRQDFTKCRCPMATPDIQPALCLRVYGATLLDWV